jgi:hypothetical protein
MKGTIILMTVLVILATLFNIFTIKRHIQKRKNDKV